MNTFIQSTTLAESPTIDFESEVYASINEYFTDLDRVRRNEEYTYIQGNLWPRSSAERNQILIDKINAKRRLELHSASGGTELMLSI